jgi:hypothetical protein
MAKKATVADVLVRRDWWNTASRPEPDPIDQIVDKLEQMPPAARSRAIAIANARIRRRVLARGARGVGAYHGLVSCAGIRQSRPSSQ